MTVNHAPILVSLQQPDTRNTHARISPITAIQNQLNAEINVNPSFGPAPPIISIISGVALSFEIPA